MLLRGNSIAAATMIVLLMALQAGGQTKESSLPGNMQTVWSVEKAWREQTPTRERICVNGLWRWQPAKATENRVPEDAWGWFKVPGCWPGISNYMQKDCQAIAAHPMWKSEPLPQITVAWYQREITVPENWKGRRIALNLNCLNSMADVFVDDKPAGKLRFPGGELDLTDHCRPGATHTLSLRVTAMPLKDVLLSFRDSNAARTEAGTVARRGLCGDVYLVSMPNSPRITDVTVTTSTRKKQIAAKATVDGLRQDTKYVVHARILDQDQTVREFRSSPLTTSDETSKVVEFSETWLPDRLWDTHSPQNQYKLSLALEDSDARTLDVGFDERFGFREFWIDGRDFYLNGSRIYLSAVPFDNAQVSAAAASYAGARESLLRLKSFGINFVYTHNYGCEPGSHLAFDEILRAADDVGMLVALSQPHFSHYDWKSPESDRDNGYAEHAAAYARMAHNHPSVVFYSTSHNATGYAEDMNPDMIDGLKEPRTSTYELNNADRALRAEAIIRRLDPNRIVYHHAGGHIGAMHTINFYPNFVPIQEMSDWFEHWATKGAKPVFTCEYGAPFAWDWGMYRGWFKGERSFGSAQVPWDFCMAEWNAQFLGDTAFRISDAEKANLRWEAGKFKSGQLWRRWEYPNSLNSKNLTEREPIMAAYLTDNFRAFRTWGVSANSPWEHEQYWKLRDGVDRRRKELPTDWQNLQRPGFSPDYIDQQYERMDLAYEQSEWVPTAAAKSLLRNNLPLLGYIAGKSAAFTSKDHLFHPGESFEKQLVVLNNSRLPVTCDCTWSLDLRQAISGQRQVSVSTGDQARVPLSFALPESLPAGTYTLRAKFAFSNGPGQEDEFVIHVAPRPEPPKVAGSVKLSLFDPQGDVAKWLKGQGISHRSVGPDAQPAADEVLIVGRNALSVDGAAPDISRVREGLRVLIFEQSADVLEKRFGFRTAEYGLRQVFPRIPDHPLARGLSADHWRDWQGESTTLPPKLTYELRPRHGPTVKWCDIPVPHLWRCGNRGNVASILIEKPARGDFLPIVDGGFSLQYSPLMEYREGRGMVLFCQLDVTGRTETDPVAEAVARRCSDYVQSWKPSSRRTVVYVGEEAGRAHLQACGITPQPFGGELSPDQVLVVGSGGAEKLDSARLVPWLKGGGRVVTIGLADQDLNNVLPFKVTTKQAEHISAWFEPFGAASPLAGLSPAEVHNRDPGPAPLVTEGANIIGDGILATSRDGNVVMCQIVPWRFAGPQLNHRKTFRRTSVLLSRILAGMGASGDTPLLERFHDGVSADSPKKRWREGLYLDQPEEWDDPYRFFRW